MKSLEKCLSVMEGMEFLLHAGDFYEDGLKVGQALGLKVVAVTGNCDYMVKGPAEEMLALGGKRIYLTHGHLYRVKQDLSPLIQRAKALKADVAVFGHTHYPVLFQRDGILFLNPGSPHSPRGGNARSFATMEVNKASVKAKIIPISTLG